MLIVSQSDVGDIPVDNHCLDPVLVELHSDVVFGDVGGDWVDLQNCSRHYEFNIISSLLTRLKKG